MCSILNWIDFDELPPLIALILLLSFIGGKMTRTNSRTFQMAGRITATTFFLYAGMGIYFWSPSGATELLVIAIRSSLAAGLAFGFALVTLAPMAYVFVRMKALLSRRPRSEPVRPRKQTSTPTVVTRDFAAEELARKESIRKIDDARREVIQFFEKNRRLVDDSLPSALFRSRIQTRFPVGISPEQAWEAAELMIAEILSLIANSRQRIRTELEEELRRQEQIQEEESNRKKLEERVNSIQRLADWYRQEQETINQSISVGQDREDALLQLFGRYDELMKETYSEMKP